MCTSAARNCWNGQIQSPPLIQLQEKSKEGREIRFKKKRITVFSHLLHMWQILCNSFTLISTSPYSTTMVLMELLMWILHTISVPFQPSVSYPPPTECYLLESIIFSLPHKWLCCANSPTAVSCSSEHTLEADLGQRWAVARWLDQERPQVGLSWHKLLPNSIPAPLLCHPKAEVVATAQTLKDAKAHFSFPSPHPCFYITMRRSWHSITLRATSEQKSSPPAPPEMTHPCTRKSVSVTNLYTASSQPGRHRDILHTSTGLIGLLARAFLQECSDQ